MQLSSFPDNNLSPFSWYHTMLEAAPVHYAPEMNMWQVFRYKDVQRVLTDTSSFSAHVITFDHPLEKSLINIDPPLHRQLRSLVTQAFTPRTVNSLVSRITQIIHELLDQGEAKGEIDVIQDFAYPLPTIVIAELLNIPTEDRVNFKRWSNDIITNEGLTESYAVMGEYFTRIIERRRKAPGNDLISALLEAQIEGEHLDLSELVSFCVFLLLAGSATTTHLISNAIICLDEHPEEMEQLRSEPALLPNAIEEVLRYRSPIKMMFRMTATDTILGGQKVEAGQMVMSWIGAANRDESQFPNPDTFDIRRSPNRHIAFGYGIHFCLGAPLARLEGKIALGIMLERWQHIQRVRDVPLEAIGSPVFYGVQKLPITVKK
ncbi:MAG: monooxygenase YjiB [Ktedonobacteraceae bacterium]